MTHTPGPWKAHHDHGWLVVESQDETLYLQVEKGTGANKHMADARLISAAPEMLDVLQRLLSDHDPHLTEQGLRNLARSIIAKATAA